MANAKQVAVLLAGALLWAGLCQVGSQVPWVGECQAGAPRDHPAAGDNRVFARAEVLPSGETVEIRSQVEQPTAILYVVPSGQTVKKGDLLVELDASALIDKRIQQVVQVQKAEGEMILAKESQAWDSQAAQGRIVVAEKALRLAQGQLKAFTEGEYPNQLAFAEGATKIAAEKRMIAQERVERLMAAFKAQAQQDQAMKDSVQAAQLALQEASLQLQAAENSLSMLKSFGHDNKTAEFELAVAQREFDLARAKDALSAAKARGGAMVSLAEMQFRMEADRLAKMDDQIVKSKIYAPRDGIVAHPSNTDEAPIKAGTVVRDRQVLIRLLPSTPPKQ
jgi:HlyD family secretion protein